MSERDSAYRILGLTNDATFEEVEEACREMKAVWHPDRFADSPELREKAEEKQRAVDHAYQILRNYHSRRSEEDVSPAALKDGESGRGPSILDDTLSERMGNSKLRFPIWIALFGLVAIAVVVSFLTWSPVDVDSDPESSEQERIVAEIRANRSAGAEDAEEEGAPVEASSVSAEDGLMEVAAPNQPAVDPPDTRPESSVASRNSEPTLQVRRPERTITPATQSKKKEPIPAEPTPEVIESAQDPVSLDEAAVEEEPVVNELAERSFQVLRAKSDLANRLVEGALVEFSYKDWKAVERSSTEVYVDLVAELASEGREVHFVWAVDVEAQSVKPMSQAARDLKATER